MNVERLAEIYSQQVSVSRRVIADLYIGNREFSTITEIVKAAFIDGYKAAMEVQSGTK